MLAVGVTPAASRSAWVIVERRQLTPPSMSCRAISTQEPEPPLDEESAGWVDTILREKGVRGRGKEANQP
jgi:hypothetical protein